MKYCIFPAFLFLVLLGCSDSEPSPELPEVEVSLPAVTTVAITEITDGSAQTGGNVTDDGGATVTARGVVWGRSTAPTISDNKTTNATGKGEFSSTLEVLDANTTYYVRAYATNSAGTGYGNQFAFTTLEEVFEENIYNGDVILKNQNDVDVFASMRYTDITGELQILGTEEPYIDDISELRSIKTISNGLFVNKLSKLKSLNGLQNLVFVAGNVLISENQGLENIEGLNGLKKITGTLIIKQNANLFSLDGLSLLESVEVISIEDNQNLKSIYGAESISTVEIGIFILGNDSLKEVDGFESILETGVVSIMDNSQLYSISGFQLLASLKGYLNTGLNISNNSILEILEGFESISLVRKNFKILENSNLKNIDGFNSLNTVEGSFKIVQNSQLTNINGFSKLQVITGNLEISNNQNLFSSGSFASLTEVRANFTLSSNEKIEVIEGFDKLAKVEGIVFLVNNPSLERIAGFNFIQGDFSSIFIGNNSSLKTLNCFKFTEDINSVVIEGSPVLTDFCSFEVFYNSGISPAQITIKDNGYNPSFEDLLDGKCKI